GGLPPFDPRPFVIGAVALLMVLTVPFIARTVQRHRRIALAASGDAAAAWAELRDSLIDQRADASTAESPRSRGRRLITGFGADASDVAQLITAVEQASYARRSDALELAGPLRRVLRQVRAHARASDRFLAAVFPRSLLQGAWSRVPLPAQA
ncbi:MAG: hypothetical protein GX539_03280, partial [Candidatus Cloacimonetes bacterium]|nr:hypothetical protein [Candidatus Cloacimonadota bacterium]